MLCNARHWATWCYGPLVCCIWCTLTYLICQIAHEVAGLVDHSFSIAIFPQWPLWSRRPLMQVKEQIKLNLGTTAFVSFRHLIEIIDCLLKFHFARWWNCPYSYDWADWISQTHHTFEEKVEIVCWGSMQEKLVLLFVANFPSCQI